MRSGTSFDPGSILNAPNCVIERALYPVRMSGRDVVAGLRPK